MNRIVILVLLIIAFFISFYDFIFAPYSYKNDNNTTRPHYLSGSGGGSYSGWSSDNSSIRGKSSNHWHRGSGSRGK